MRPVRACIGPPQRLFVSAGVAQWVEHPTFNRRDAGSTPRRLHQPKLGPWGSAEYDE